MTENGYSLSLSLSLPSPPPLQYLPCDCLRCVVIICLFPSTTSSWFCSFLSLSNTSCSSLAIPAALSRSSSSLPLHSFSLVLRRSSAESC